jgi:hypothetical protein
VIARLDHPHRGLTFIQSKVALLLRLPVTPVASLLEDGLHVTSKVHRGVRGGGNQGDQDDANKAQ